jgi:hypothetical protein
MPLAGGSHVVLLATFVAVMTQLRTCTGGTHLPTADVSFQQLSPQQAAAELRTCAATYATGSSGPEPSVFSDGWAGWLLQNESTPVVVGPLVPKAGSSLLRVMFGDRRRPDALTDVTDFLRLRGRTDTPKAEAATSKLWFAVIRDPLTRFVDAYVQMSDEIDAARHSGCDFSNVTKAKCVRLRGLALTVATIVVATALD